MLSIKSFTMRYPRTTDGEREMHAKIAAVSLLAKHQHKEIRILKPFLKDKTSDIAQIMYVYNTSALTCFVYYFCWEEASNDNESTPLP